MLCYEEGYMQKRRWFQSRLGLPEINKLDSDDEIY
jgi:hypothetical protein